MDNFDKLFESIINQSILSSCMNYTCEDETSRENCEESTEQYHLKTKSSSEEVDK